MSHQSKHREVIEADRMINEKADAIRRHLRRLGIRVPKRVHTPAFERAVSMPNRLPPVRGRGE
jgi:hypothetical protein